MTSETRLPSREDVPAGVERRLWFGILAGPTAWTVHEIASYAIAAESCGRAGELGAAGWFGLVGIDVLAAALTAAALRVAYGVFRAASGGGRITAAEGWGRVEFMAMAGVFTSALLLLNIIYFSIMPLLIDPCLRVR